MKDSVLIRAAVKGYLDTAVNENGYTELLSGDPMEVACDFRDFCAGYEDTPLNWLSGVVTEWQNERRNANG